MAEDGDIDPSHGDGKPTQEQIEMVSLRDVENNTYTSYTESFHDVYVWMPRGKQVGHASVMLSNRTYISLWPDDDKTKCRVFKKAMDRSVRPEDDIYKESFEPHYTFRIPAKKLDVLKMQAFWDEWKRTGEYGLFFKNCCWLVYSILREGGAPRSATVLWRPETLRRYLRIYENDGHWIRAFFNLW
ncbi:uncharacterized protein LOC124151589 [Haliotis rufescens]|uniref:uncharacterized protein LOC124151589 n=1 Tax=Haliotis rufescens TaxID=6454 RepID=UPI00201F9356|nr:uncharacterized protein LOC124151589 [Haliotis rufescens]